MINLNHGLSSHWISTGAANVRVCIDGIFNGFFRLQTAPFQISRFRMRHFSGAFQRIFHKKDHEMMKDMIAKQMKKQTMNN